MGYLIGDKMKLFFLAAILAATPCEAANISLKKTGSTIIFTGGGGSDPTKLPLAGGVLTGPTTSEATLILQSTPTSLIVYGDIVSSRATSSIEMTTGTFAMLQSTAGVIGNLEASTGVFNTLQSTTGVFSVISGTMAALMNVSVSTGYGAATPIYSQGNDATGIAANFLCQTGTLGGCATVVSNTAGGTAGVLATRDGGSSYAAMTRGTDRATFGSTASSAGMEIFDSGKAELFSSGGQPAIINGNGGNVELQGAGVKVPAGIATGYALCINASSMLSVCTSAVAVDGSCTCP